MASLQVIFFSISFHRRITDSLLAPFCGLLLSSYGASVIRVDRPGSVPTRDALTSYKSSIALDLKNPSSLAIVTSLIPKTDIVIDPFRPGVLEKLGLNPSDLLKHYPRLIVVHLTGFRRDGKYKAMAGLDINYLAVSGVLSMLGECGQPPSPPINLLGDFAGGGMVAFQGALLALLQRSTSGRGQIVEANIVDGVNFLGTYPRLASKVPLILSGERSKNALDGGAPYYRCYECKDTGRYMSVGALEPQFFEQLLKGLRLSIDEIVPGKIVVRARQLGLTWKRCSHDVSKLRHGRSGKISSTEQTPVVYLCWR